MAFYHYFIKPMPEVLSRLDDLKDRMNLVLDNQEYIMSSLDDLKAKQDATDALIAAVKADVEKLITALAAVPPSGLTPEQQTALDAANAHADAINSALSAVDAEVNPKPVV